MTLLLVILAYFIIFAGLRGVHLKCNEIIERLDQLEDSFNAKEGVDANPSATPSKD